MSIKICHMTSVHNSNDIRIFQKECVSLAKNMGFQVTLIAPGESRVESKVNVIGVGERPINRLRRMFSFSKLVYERALEINADIYHFHDPELLKYGLMLKRRGKKVIFDSHEYTYSQILIKDYIPRSIRNIIAKLYKKIENKICARLDAVIFPCTIDGKHPFDGVGKRTEIIGNLPDISLFKPEHNEIKKFDICCTGSLSKARGTTILLEAAKDTGSSVVLAGDFDSDHYKKELETGGLLENVTLLGKCTHDEIIRVLGDSKICVSNILNVGQYSNIENLPTKVYEAMAMKLPVIMSDFLYPRTVNQELIFALLVDPSSKVDLTNAIRTLCSDQKMRMKLGNNGRMLVEKYFNWENDAKKLKNLYLRIIRNH